jgi:single-stranded DNA-specific DHH superfamily exonuclease
MLTKEQLQEIREHLEKARNPVFFFDNDVDGLCSFLLLQRFIGRGKGIPIKSYPGLEKTYFKRVEELGADYIFVLDKPVVDLGFIELVKQANLPLVVIDHHASELDKEGVEFFYNTYETSKQIEPTSYLCYKVAGKKEEQWLALLGCIADCYLPDFLEDFKKENPEMLAGKNKSAFDIYYNTELGKIARILGFGLLDKTSNVVIMMKFLTKISNIHDINQENANTKSFLSRFDFISERYNRILKKAEEQVNEDKKNKLLFFIYSGEMSISQEISNELSYRYPKKVVVVLYSSGGKANISIRGYVNVKDLLLKSIADIEGARGGGHEHSCGGRMPSDGIAKFKENLIREMKVD